VQIDFLIVTTGRTGSSHLVSLLDSHPRVRCFEEPFNRTSVRPETFGNSSHDDEFEFLDELTAGADGRLTGIKLPWNSLIEYPRTLALFSDPSVRIVHLLRADRLGQYVSIQMAHLTGIWHSTSGEQPVHDFALDVVDFRQWLKSVIFADAALAQLSHGHPRFELDYAELADPARVAALQAWLGLEPAQLSSRFTRLRRRPPAESVTNWDAVVETVAGSEDAWTLDLLEDGTGRPTSGRALS
jgi:LPS sulfotransferase NodH